MRKRAMGDVLWIEPVIRQLASSHRKLIVHTKFNELFRNYPVQNVFFKDKLSFWERLIIALEKKIGTSFFSINLDDAYESQPDVHFLHAYQKKAGTAVHDEYPKLYLSDAEKNKRLIKGKYAVLHIESFSDKKFRQLMGINWQEIVDYLHQYGWKVVQLGVNSDHLPGTIRIKTSIRELISLIDHAGLFVGIDSGPSHLAASLKIPSLIVFGALDPRLRHFPGQFNGVLLKQACGESCVNIISDEKDHHCSLTQKENIPPCCYYDTKTILSSLQKIIHAAEIHQ